MVGSNRARCFFFSSRRRHTRFDCDWSSDVCSSDLFVASAGFARATPNGGVGGAVAAPFDDPTDPAATATPTAATSERAHQNQNHRSEERRVGKSVDLGGRRIIKKKKEQTQK